MKDDAGEGIPPSAVSVDGRALPRKVRASIAFAAQDLTRVNIIGPSRGRA
ncbi:hypothetical protein [Roseospira marina]|nr:hypothetical protein [Roseospira marina]MBB4314182.1 hypothetical protein [Roseospira marina]